VGKTEMDKRGRVLIPAEEREILGLKSGTKFELGEEQGVLLLKPIVPDPIRVRSAKEEWEGGALASLPSYYATSPVQFSSTHRIDVNRPTRRT